MRLFCEKCKKAMPVEDAVFELFSPETRDQPAEYYDPTCPVCGDTLTDDFFECENCSKAEVNEKKWSYDQNDVCYDCFRELCKENPNLTSPMATVIAGVKKISGGVI